MGNETGEQRSERKRLRWQMRENRRKARGVITVSLVGGGLLQLVFLLGFTASGNEGEAASAADLAAFGSMAAILGFLGLFGALYGFYLELRVLRIIGLFQIGELGTNNRD